VYQRAAFLNPEKNYHICLAQLLEHLNKPEAAVVEYRKKFDKEEEVSLILVRHFANALGNAGNYEEAIKHYQEYLGYDRDDGLFHHNLGLALYKFKKLEEAIVEFQIAVQLDPTERRFQKSLEAAIQERSNPNLRINNKKSLLGCRFVDSLVNSATLDITQIFGDVQHQEELKQQAKAEQQRGKQKQTENEQKQRSITENKGNFDITLELPLTANEMQTGVDKQVILDDGTVTIKVPSGITQGKLIRIRSKGKFNSDTQERGNLYLKIVKTSIATPANSAYEASTEAFLHGLSGDALRKEGKLEEAITEYRKAIQVNPNNGTNYHSLGIALYEQGKLEEAITEYRKAIQLGPISNTGSLNGYDNSGVAITHYSLGIALYKQGKLEEAIAEYRKAIQINPYLTVAREGLETALKAQK
jgi:tetratricopeptide (TPR) repeat protein